jgi:hypothetical protein
MYTGTNLTALSLQPGSLWVWWTHTRLIYTTLCGLERALGSTWSNPKQEEHAKVHFLLE